MREIFDWLGRSGGLPRWLEILTMVSTAAAAALAALAIWQAGRQAKRSADAIQRERRIDFELDVLLEMLDWVIRSFGTERRAERLTDLAKLFGEARLPLLRAALGLPSTEQVQAEVESKREYFKTEHTFPMEYYREQIRDEIRAEMVRLVHERDAPSDAVVSTP